MVLIDTNILLRYLLQDHAELSPKATQIIIRALDQQPNPCQTRNMKYNSKLSAYKLKKIIKCFCIDIDATRTALLLDDFAEALKIPDVAIISEILPVRETNTYNIYSTDLGAKVPNSVCLDTFEEITDYVCKNAKEGDLILTMGGGNVYMCANMIYNQLKYNEENK